LTRKFNFLEGTLKTSKLKPICAAVSLFLLAAGGATYSGASSAQALSDVSQAQQIQMLKQQMEVLSRKLDELSTKQADAAKSQPALSAPTAQNGQTAPVASVVSAPMVQNGQTAANGDSGWGAGMPPKLKSLLAALGNMEFYGNLDLSVDYATKGLKNSYVAPDGTVVRPRGQMGWQPDISSNLSYIGVRGKRPFGSDANLAFVYQLETQIDVSATSGPSPQTNSAQDPSVKGGLTSRNSFIGVASPTWGALKIGKTDAPYKTSTSRMNPFVGTLGDYSAIMGNTGGDNRAEFMIRLDHALWYESPNFHGWTFNALVSPGQNRGFENETQAAGEPNCTGGDAPGSGAAPLACNDGSYGSAYSANLAYSHGPLYFTTAWELHKGVNRSGDVLNTPAAIANAVDGGTDPNDIGNEWAFKVGAQYVLPTRTTVSAIYEVMRRNIPAYLQTQNERSRNGFWVAVTQELTPKDVVSVGWAHANRTPGDPGQINTAPANPNDVGIANPSNGANMITAMYKHAVDKHTTVYVDYAMTINQSMAHYDLGAGGRGVAIDCHDGSSLQQGSPFCFAGGREMGVSVGMNYKF
jgi:predicted porin